MKAPTVSVIVPVYNAEKFLKPCLNSIVKQTLKDIEIILVDDGSSDSSLDILKQYAEKDKRIKIVRQKNSGPGIARNKGISLAKGKYISFMDADDFFEPDLLENMHNKIEKTKSDIVFCRFWMFNQETQLDQPPEYDVSMELLPEDETFSYESYPDNILNLYITAVWSSMYRRDFVIKNELKFSYATRVEDNLFAQTAIAMAERISFLNSKLIHYRRFFHTSLTDKANQYWMNSFIVHKEIRDYLIEHDRYERVRSSFLHHMLNHFRYHVIERCNEPTKSIAAFYTQKYLHDEFDLDLWDIAKYTDEYTYLFYQKIYRKYNTTSELEKYLENNPEHIVPVVYAANEKYVPVLSVSLQSLIENTKSKNFYDIYIFNSDISAENEARLERLTGGNIRVTCVDVKDKLPKDEELYPQFHYSEEMFYRFLAPQIIYGYDKILYLDVDTLILHDVAELYSTDMANFSLAACVQPLQKDFQKYCSKKLKCNPENYINSGVLLFNVKNWNKADFTEKCFALVGKKGNWLAPDQDILNIVCKDDIKYLDARWNTVATITLRFKKDYFSADYKNEIKKLYEAYLLHYTSSLKPWYYKNSAEAKIWWKYAKKSVFYEKL